MATINLTLDYATGGGQPYASGVVKIAQATAGDSPTGWVDGKFFPYPLSNPATVLGTNGFAALTQGQTYAVIDPAGVKSYVTMPASSSANISDLLPVVIPLPTPSQIIDSAVAAAVSSGTATPTAVDTRILAKAAPKVSLAGQSLSVYGPSYDDEDGMVPTVIPTAAGMYYRLAAADLGGDAPISYGRSSMRSDFGVGSLVSTATWPGRAYGPKAGALWPGVSSRPGPVVLGSFLVNDISHAASGVATPITGAGGARYVAGNCAGSYDAFCAIASSESRKDVVAGSSVILNGGWTLDAQAYMSGGSYNYTTTAGANAIIGLTAAQIPQTGPLAGRVWLGVSQFDPAIASNAPIAIYRDGAGTPFMTWTPTEWETYDTNAFLGYAVVPVDVPADGADHVIQINHAGTTGQLLGLDAIYLPSPTPPEIYVMGAADIVVGSLFDAAHLAIWKANKAIVEPAIKAAIAKHPNAMWVPSTRTAGTYISDGVHPGAIGHQQMRTDLVSAIRTVRTLGMTEARETQRKATLLDLANKADLGADGKVPVSQLPSLGSTTVLSSAQTATAIPLPTTATTARIKGKGASGGGGSGRRGATSTYRGGGGSGGTGGEFEFTLDLVSLRASGVTTLYAWIGAKGTGGAAKTTDTTDGSAGTDGGETFISTSSSVTAATAKAASLGWGGGGSGGFGGNTSSNGNGGAAGYGSTRLGGAGASGSGSTGAAGAGGAGGGITASNSVSAGGASDTATDTNSAYVTTGNYLAGGAIGTAGLNASTAASQKAIGASPLGGSGGGGSNTAAGGNGGNGSNGGSGGGGGASINGFASGKGGDGSDGVLMVTFS